ncbi:MAG: STAS domain-containing protein [Planctomycetota bacterium]|nr:STAS domain-containing protein [Planctomycetota bacterium]
MAFELQTLEMPNGSTELIVKGSLDSYSFQDLHDTVMELLEKGRKNIVLNLSKVDRMSSAGAGTLLDILGQCSNADATLLLRSPSPAAKQVLQMLGLLDLFTVKE